MGKAQDKVRKMTKKIRRGTVLVERKMGGGDESASYPLGLPGTVQNIYLAPLTPSQDSCLPRG